MINTIALNSPLKSSALSSPSSRDIVKSFVPNAFVPQQGIFGLSTNQHYQTIIGSEALQMKFRGDYPRTFKATPDRIYTPDGDFLDLEFVHFAQQDGNIRKECEDKKSMIVILHGLESSSKGPLVTKMTMGFLSKGFSCCLVNFRGCSGEDNLTTKCYHLGYTKDVDLVCKTLSERLFVNSVFSLPLTFSTFM
jgi:predicted alpha/beta-fold hydrolase